VFIVIIGITSQCVYCVCYANIRVLDLLSEVVCDESGMRGKEKDGKNVNLVDVNE